MGLRPTVTVDSSTNSDATNEMAPALTEPAIVKNKKLRFSSSPITTTISAIPAGVSFQSAFEKHLIVSDGPKSGSLMKAHPMDQEKNQSSNHQEQHHINSTNDFSSNKKITAQESISILQETQKASTSVSTVLDQQTIVQSISQSHYNQTLHHNNNNIISTGSTSSGSIQNAMGLQKKRDEENAEMEQILGDLASTSEIDLLQVFKSLESTPAGDGLCDLAGSLALFNDVDVMNMCSVVEDVSTTPVKIAVPNEIRLEIEKRQQQMQRKCDFLMRRLRKLQARQMGQHISEEVGHLYSDAFRLYKRKEREQQQKFSGDDQSISSTPTHSNNNYTEKANNKPITPTAMKTFLKKINHVSATQSAALAKHNQMVRLNNDIKMNSSPPIMNVSSASQSKLVTIVPELGQKSADKLEQVGGMLQTELRIVEKAIDSDATASSSGGESADELISYNNPTQETLSISKRAAWRWARDRASIATRWSWLLAQISDLEYRIRQHNELHHQIKKNKGAVLFEDGQQSSSSVSNQQSVNGFRGILPGNSKSLDVENSPNGVFESGGGPTTGSARTRAFQRSGFRKRKLLQTVNLHTISKKAARPSTVKCGCQWPLQPCALCTGRHDPMAPRDLPDTMPASERVALLDPCFHSVLSFPEDVSHSVHFEAIMRLPEWQNKAMRITKTSLKGTLAAQKAAEREDRLSNINKNKTFMVEGRRKYSKKFGLVSNKQLKKSLKSRRTAAFHGKFSTSHLVHNPKSHRKLSTQSRAASSGSDNGMLTSVAAGRQLHMSSIMMTIGGSDDGINSTQFSLSRSKNGSPTPTYSNNYLNRSEKSDIRKSRNSYDIDNIVIPYSVAAATRVELLPYKEIPTPKWRVVSEDEMDEQVKKEDEDKLEEEDTSEEITYQKHDRALQEERKKFQTFLKFPWSTRSRANRRTDSRAESSGTNTPDPTSPAPATPLQAIDQENSISSPGPPILNHTLDLADPDNSNTAVIPSTSTQLVSGNNGKRTIERRRTISTKLGKDPLVGRDDVRRSNTPDIREVIQPYEPLKFPLPENIYEEMLKLMPDEHKQIIDNCLESLEPSDQKSESIDLNHIDIHHTKSDNNIIEMNAPEHNIVISRTTILAKNLDKTIDEESEDTESIDSIIAEEDPNDPEWQSDKLNNRL